MNKNTLYDLMNQRAEAMKLAEKALTDNDQTAYNEQMEAVKGLNEQIERWNALNEQKGLHKLPESGAPAGTPKAAEPELTGYEKAVKAFADAARTGFRAKAIEAGSMMNTEVGADGGYTVPEDIVTRIVELRDVKETLLSEVQVVSVTTMSGRRTMKKRGQHTGFATVAEAAKYPKKEGPQFATVSYEIEKRGGFLPVTTELYEDSDANIAAVAEGWLADEAAVTANRMIMEQVSTKLATGLDGLDGIIKGWIGLGAAFRATSKIYTNDDGLAWLATLKDKNDRYLLSPNPADAKQLQLAAGPHVIPVKTYDNDTMPTDGTKIPMIIGDLKQGVVYWDRRQFTLKVSDVAVAGDLNAFEEDLILWRGSMRSDCTLWDDTAFVNGYVDTGAAG